jgi:hypothetical protein
VGRKPFEIVAECEMTGFPAAADIERVGAQIEKARRSRPDVVRAAVSSPAVYRDRQYVLDTRFVVWADDGAGAARAVGELLKAAGVPCRTVVPSGRALTEADVSTPAKAAPSASAPRRAKPRPADPARKIARPARKMARPARKVARPAREIARPARKIARPARKARKAPRRAPAGASKRAVKRPIRQPRRARGR